jgi:hypothetical protein
VNVSAGGGHRDPAVRRQVRHLGDALGRDQRGQDLIDEVRGLDSPYWRRDT